MPSVEKTDINKIFSDLKTSDKGLSQADAEKRMGIYGKNELTEKNKVSALSILASQFKSVLILLLIVAAIFAAYIGDYIDSSIIIIIVIANALLGFRQEYKAERTLEALRQLTAPKSVVLRDGKHVEIDASELVPGDIVLLEEGNKVPADMVLIESTSLKVNEAPLTGESEDVSKKEESKVFSGTVVTYGHAKAVVSSTGMSTEIGKIATVIQDETKDTTPLQKRLDSFGKRIGLLVIAISVILIATGLARGGEIAKTIEFGIALAVAAVPEGLPAIVTVTMAFGVQRMAQKKAIIRKLTAVESLGSTTFICADKTGTITKNEMTVTEIYADEVYRITGVGRSDVPPEHPSDSYSGEGAFYINEKKVDPKSRLHLMSVLKAGTLCNNASGDVSASESDSYIGDSTEIALLVAAKKAASMDYYSEQRIAEIPFSSERKIMSTINNANGRLRLYAKGAPEILLKRCSKIYVNGRELPMTQEDMKKLLQQNEKMASKALRVLCIAYKDNVASNDIDEKDENDLTFLGLAGMIDPAREDVANDVKICKEAGIKIAMITGDHTNTAKAIAEQIGIDVKNTLTGDDLEKLSDAELEKLAEKVQVYARVNPIQKLRIVNALKKKGHIVAMTGDGVNDAPALKRADAGIAMGIKGTDVAKEASDMILSDDNFSTIVSAIKEGRTIYNNIRNFIIYLLSSNIAEVIIIAFAMLVLGPEYLPLTAVQLLWINLVTDGIPATALGLDPSPPDIMKQKPRDPKENLLSRKLLLEVSVIGLIIAMASLSLFITSLGQGLLKAQTVVFTSLVVFEFVRVYSVRMKSKIPLASNKKLLVAIVMSLIMQLVIVYLPAAQQIFGTTFLSFVDWIMILSVGAISFLVTLVVQRKM